MATMIMILTTAVMPHLMAFLTLVLMIYNQKVWFLLFDQIIMISMTLIQTQIIRAVCAWRVIIVLSVTLIIMRMLMPQSLSIICSLLIVDIKCE